MLHELEVSCSPSEISDLFLSGERKVCVGKAGGQATKKKYIYTGIQKALRRNCEQDRDELIGMRSTLWLWLG